MPPYFWPFLAAWDGPSRPGERHGCVAHVFGGEFNWLNSSVETFWKFTPNQGGRENFNLMSILFNIDWVVGSSNKNHHFTGVFCWYLYLELRRLWQSAAYRYCDIMYFSILRRPKSFPQLWVDRNLRIPGSFDTVDERKASYKMGHYQSK